jgi:hypothetical protein
MIQVYFSYNLEGWDQDCEALDCLPKTTSSLQQLIEDDNLFGGVHFNPGEFFLLVSVELPALPSIGFEFNLAAFLEGFEFPDGTSVGDFCGDPLFITEAEIIPIHRRRGEFVFFLGEKQ